MAERRMFAKTIVLSDAFLDMPLSARCLYFTLGMLADDDGFINSPKSVMRQCGASEDDLRVLMSKKFVLAFQSGVIVIKHWRINNYLRQDRHTDTKYVEEKESLVVNENGSYSFGIPLANQVTTTCQPSDNQLPTTCQAVGIPSIDKNSIDKYRDIVLYLNDKSGKNFRYSSRKTKELIQARLNDGFSVDDFKTVIDKKTAEWKDDKKMNQYLRPETLFGTKFEAYLNQQEVTGNKTTFNNFDQRDHDWDKIDELFNR